MEQRTKELGYSILTGPPCPDNIRSITHSFMATVYRTSGNIASSSPSQPHDQYGFSSLPLKERRGVQEGELYTASVRRKRGHDDAGVQWSNTGDEAVIDEAGQVSLTERHAETIVGSGENTSPMAIETAISCNPELAKLEIAIVGTPDSIDGHPPVVIVKQPGIVADPHTATLLRHTILNEMGPSYAPVAVLTLEALGLPDWPKTTTGKLQRSKITSRVEGYFESKQASGSHSVVPCFGSEISEGSAATARDSERSGDGEMDREPKEEKLVPTDEQKYAITESLRACGLSWEDCDSLLAPPDMSEIMSRYAAFNGRAASFALCVPGKSDVGFLKDSLKRLFKQHPLLLSHYARTGSQEAFHVLLRHEPHVLDRFVKVRPSLKSMEDLLAVPRGYSVFRGPASIPGLVTSAEIFEVQEPSSCTALVLTVNHVVMDATYVQMILDDLDTILSREDNKLGQYIGYDVWTKAYHSRRASRQAEAASDWYIKQLRDFHLYEESIWPLHRAESDKHQHGFQHNFCLEKIAGFREAHPEIQPSTVFKAAMMLAMAATTSRKHVAFSSCEAARSRMPFIDDAEKEGIPDSVDSVDVVDSAEAIDVAGPTYGVVFELSVLSDQDKVSQVLLELEQRQHELTNNTTACWRDIYARLVKENRETSVRALEKLSFALAFSWVPDPTVGSAAGGEYQQLQLLETYFPSVGGLEVQCSLNGPGQRSASLQLSGTGLDVDGMQRFALKMETALRLLCEEPSGNVLVMDVLAALRSLDRPVVDFELVTTAGATGVLERPRSVGKGSKRMAV